MKNLSDIIKIYAKEYKISREYASTICNSVFETLGKTLYTDKEDVYIHHFGTFKHKKMAQKRVRHPETGELINIPARDVIKFKKTESILWDEEENNE